MDIYDLRHDKRADNPRWRHIVPADGFHWTVRKGTLVLHSSENFFESWSTAYPDAGRCPVEIGRIWNGLGGEVHLGDRTISISKENYSDGRRSRYRTRGMHDVAELKEALAALIGFGIDGGFAIKGTPKGFPARTVAEALEMADPVHEILDGDGPIVMYHGTSLERWRRIQREGLVPGRVKLPYNDLVPGYSETKVYLAAAPWTAEFYARRQQRWDDDAGWVVLAVFVPDRSLVRADDACLVYNDQPFEEQGAVRERIAKGLREKGEACHAGAIPAESVRPVRFFPAAAADAVIERTRPPVPRRFLVPEEALAAIPSRDRFLNGAAYGVARFRSDDPVENLLEGARPSSAVSRRRAVTMAGHFDWEVDPPEGFVSVLPLEATFTGHDRSWLDEARTFIEIGDESGAHRAAEAYWSGERLHGDWEYLAPLVKMQATPDCTIGPVPKR